jgi:hypothetical protein
MFARCGRSRLREAIRIGLGLARTIAAIADAARRWCDADFPPRVRTTRALIARTGYTEPVVDYALDALFGGIDAVALRAAIAGELGTPDALERFVERAGRPAVRYAGVARATIVSSETTIGVAIVPAVFALCAGATTIVKDRSDGLVAAFGETLAEERPELGALLHASSWDASDATERARALDADTVVAYGRGTTLAAIRAQLAPETRFVGFGHRTSVGYVAREALSLESDARDAARRVARDVLLYDGDGCLSIHAIFAERGGAIEPRTFARMLGEACDEIAIEFPAAFTTLDAAALAYRRAALFRASQGRGDVFGGVVTPHVVTYDQPGESPPPFVRRSVTVVPVDGANDALGFVRRHGVGLEAIGFARTPRADLEAFAVDSGASRVAALGDLQRPPLGGEHGGSGRILPFVRAIYRA